MLTVINNIRFLLLYVVVISLSFFSSTFSFASSQSKVAVIFSSDIKPYQQSFKGFKDYFAEERIILHISEYHLKEQAPGTIIQKIMMEDPDIVYVIGPQATMLASKKIEKIPVIFSMVLDYRNFNNPNFTGVYLDVPVRVKLEYFKRILPEAKRIGVIYSSKFAPIVNNIERECDRMKFQLFSRKVSSGKEFVKAFKELYGKIDSFMMVPDTKIYFKQSVRHLFLEGLRRKLPVIGLSSAFTKAGAFASLESDYYESGKLAGSIALRIKNGTKPYDIKPMQPEHVKLSVNLLVASRLGISIPSYIIKESSEVFGK